MVRPWGTTVQLIIWLGLFPARRQILESRSWVLLSFCLWFVRACAENLVVRRFNRDVVIWQRCCEHPVKPSMPIRIPSQIAVDCKSVHSPSGPVRHERGQTYRSCRGCVMNGILINIHKVIRFHVHTLNKKTIEWMRIFPGHGAAQLSSCSMTEFALSEQGDYLHSDWIFAHWTRTSLWSTMTKEYPHSFIDSFLRVHVCYPVGNHQRASHFLGRNLPTWEKCGGGGR